MATRRRHRNSSYYHFTEPGGKIGNFSDTGNRLRAGPRMASNPAPDELRGGHFCGRRPAGPRLRLQSRPQPDDDLRSGRNVRGYMGRRSVPARSRCLCGPRRQPLPGGRSRPCGKEDDHLRRGADDPGHPRPVGRVAARVASSTVRPMPGFLR